MPGRQPAPRSGGELLLAPLSPAASLLHVRRPPAAPQYYTAGQRLILGTGCIIRSLQGPTTIVNPPRRPSGIDATRPRLQ